MKTLRSGLCLFLTLGAGMSPAAAAKKPCQPTLSQCPQCGCAKENTPDALSNILKHNLAPVGEAKQLSFKDFRALQDQAEKKFDGKYSTLTKPDRARLRKLKAGEETVGEGDLVELVGYIAVKPEKSKPHANTSGESVNCRLPKSENNDFHISMAPGPDGSEFEGIVVEMIPQQRDDKWTEDRLKQVQQAHRVVRVRGQLFFDNHHVVNANPQHSLSNQPKRMSLWEIHPVTEFDVCTKDKCEADGNGWKPLAEWP
jgi:hypothetical protein